MCPIPSPLVFVAPTPKGTHRKFRQDTRESEGCGPTHMRAWLVGPWPSQKDALALTMCSVLVGIEWIEMWGFGLGFCCGLGPMAERTEEGEMWNLRPFLIFPTPILNVGNWRKWGKGKPGPTMFGWTMASIWGKNEYIRGFGKMLGLSGFGLSNIHKGGFSAFVKKFCLKV